MPQKIKRILPVILVMAVLGATIFYLSRQSQAKNGPLAASGVVEVIEVVVTIQVGGQISEVLISEGQAVQSGEVLIRFEDELLQAQYQQTEAALSQAKTNYQLIVAQPLSEQRQVAIANAQLELLSAEKALQDLIDNADLARAQAQQNIETGENALEDLRDPDLQQALALEAIAIAKKMVDENTKRVRNLTSTASQSDIDAAAANLTLLKDVLDKANEDYGVLPHVNLELTAEQRVEAVRVLRDAGVLHRTDGVERNWTIPSVAELRASDPQLDLATVCLRAGVMAGSLGADNVYVQRISSDDVLGME